MSVFATAVSKDGAVTFSGPRQSLEDSVRWFMELLNQNPGKSYQFGWWEVPGDKFSTAPANLEFAKLFGGVH
jgi:hypothetical protein